MTERNRQSSAEDHPVERSGQPGFGVIVEVRDLSRFGKAAG
ncbi:MAG TPA: hypothetical protein VG127_02050 [Rubrobacteraceae bacterium]|nr:hypothetical protein [Rubrobacteraceae bacterium]